MLHPCQGRRRRGKGVSPQRRGTGLEAMGTAEPSLKGKGAAVEEVVTRQQGHQGLVPRCPEGEATQVVRGQVPREPQLPRSGEQRGQRRGFRKEEAGSDPCLRTGAVAALEGRAGAESRGRRQGALAVPRRGPAGRPRTQMRKQRPAGWGRKSGHPWAWGPSEPQAGGPGAG